MQRPNDAVLRKARTSLRGLASGGPSEFPSLNLIADAIRLQLEKRRRVAILYINLEHYGRLEPLFGWHIVKDILDAVAASLRSMAGNTLRQLDTVSDFTLTDDAFVVLLSPPRGGDVITDEDLAVVVRRVHERLRSLLLNDLAPGVYDRVFPTVGAVVLSADDALTFGQSLERGIAAAMQAAGDQADDYAVDLEEALADCIGRGGFDVLFEPVVDVATQVVTGYRSSVRGPHHTPLRLPDVLLDVAQRSSILGSYGVAARATAVRSAVGLRPEDLLFMDCAVAELPNAAVVALSEFYSLNPALVPQHVVFDLSAEELGINAASTVRTLADVREMGFQLSFSGVSAQLRTLELIAEIRPQFLCLDPRLLTSLGTDPTSIEVVQLLVRFSARVDARLIATGVQDAGQERLLAHSGVELFSGELFARPDTHLPSVSFRP